MGYKCQLHCCGENLVVTIHIYLFWSERWKGGTLVVVMAHFSDVYHHNSRIIERVQTSSFLIYCAHASWKHLVACFSNSLTSSRQTKYFSFMQTNLNSFKILRSSIFWLVMSTQKKRTSFLDLIGIRNKHSNWKTPTASLLNMIKKEDDGWARAGAQE